VLGKRNAPISFGRARSQEGVEWVIVRLERNAPYNGDRTGRMGK